MIAFKFARLDRHSPEPDHSGGEVYETAEVSGPAIISCREASEMLQPVEAALDAVSPFVGYGIVRDEDFPGPVGRDHRHRTYACDLVAESIAVIGFVGEYCTAGLTFDQSWSRSDVAHLAGRDDEA